MGEQNSRIQGRDMERLASQDTDEITWKKISEKAWFCQKKARVLGTTKVGAATLSSRGEIFVGCNVEHRFRSHDIHAEVSAISSLVSQGEAKLEVILVVAERDNFTPCGSCMDWIYELGGPECVVGFQNKKSGPIKKYLAKDLMPYYPK